MLMANGMLESLISQQICTCACITCTKSVWQSHSASSSTCLRTNDFLSCQHWQVPLTHVPFWWCIYGVMSGLPVSYLPAVLEEYLPAMLYVQAEESQHCCCPKCLWIV